MEKRCEFCAALTAVVYCKSDAAHLCLSCDAKVHSANALSYRHLRTLVCESCRYHPSHVRCIDHEMFMCQTCDSTHHISLGHSRNVITCYMGCPSAKDLAELWGFELESNCIESEGGSSSRGTMVVNNNKKQQKGSYLILQQILELERLQLSEGADNPCLLHVKERTGGLAFRHDTMWREHSHLDHSNVQSEGSPLDDNTVSSPFSQLDNLTSTANPLHGDSFWQYNEIWLENMQDLGMCDEVRCFDDVNIPDVDLTFRNFEELFGTEKETSRAVVDDGIDMECSLVDKLPSFGKLDRGCTSITEESNDVNREINTHDKVHQSQSTYPHPIRPSYSASSCSVSRITGESSGSEYKDDGLYPTFPQHNSKSDGKEKAITRYREKKVIRHDKQGKCTSPTSKSSFKKREKSHAVKVEGLECGSANVTRSF